MVYRQQRPCGGVVLLRLEDERASNKIAIIHRLLERYPDQLTDRFVVVTETHVRFAR
jgi:hypothetical protein